MEASVADAMAPSSSDKKIVKDPNVDEHPKTPSPALSDNNERIQKAESFLRNEDIENIADSTKREYLEKKVGMSRDEVNAAMERAAIREGVDRFDRGKDRTSRDARYDDLNRGGRGLQRRYDDIHDDRYSRHGNRGRDHQMVHGRSPYETSMQTRPPYHDPYNNLNSNGSLPPDQDMHDKSSFSLTSWAGGFSLGIFGLAALRWLNGGDFVLFPPPTASDHQIEKEAGARDISSGTERGINEHEDEEVTSYLGDIEECDEETEEYDLDDGALSSILNGASNAQNHHPANIQPSSYDDLVSEIRALSSAVHSYREEQERTNRAAVAKVGAVVTDDVMDFLREDKNKSKDEDTVMLVKSQVENINVIMKEVCDDLNSLKVSLSRVNEENRGGDGTKSDSDVLTNIESIIEKLQTAVGCFELANKEDNKVALSNGVKSSSHLPNDEIALSSLVDSSIDQIAHVELKQTHDSKQISYGAEQSSSSPSHDNSEKEQKTGQVDKDQNAPCDEQQQEVQNVEVEQALRTLSNENSGEELKTGAQMLYLYIMNISKNPTVPRYRKIYTNNSAYQKKVGNLNGADELLSAVGFVNKPNFYEWSQPKDSMDTQSLLELALVALDMMRKGTSPETSSSIDQPEKIESNADATNSEVG